MWWGVLEPRSGSEQRGRRPLLIVSNDGFNKTDTWRSLIVIPLTTSKNQRKRGPTIVEIPDGLFEGSVDGTAICHQVTTLDRSKLKAKIGSVDDTTMKQIEIAIMAALQIRA